MIVDRKNHMRSFLGNNFDKSLDDKGFDKIFWLQSPLVSDVVKSMENCYETRWSSGFSI